MTFLDKRIQRIKEMLQKGSLRMASSLLIHAVASDDLFGYWSSCCRGSERVPKILKYIRHISFRKEVPTAAINFMNGELRIGVRFFEEHIHGPEDFLFLLVHERNHLILRNLILNERRIR